MLLADAQKQNLVQPDNLDCPKFEKWTGKADTNDKNNPANKYTSLTPFQWQDGVVHASFGTGPSDFIQLTLDQFWAWSDKPAPTPPAPPEAPAQHTAQPAHAGR